MEMKNEIVLSVTKEERVYRMHLPAGCPLGEATDAAFEMFMQVDNFYKENREKLKEKRDAEAKEAEGEQE